MEQTIFVEKEVLSESYQPSEILDLDSEIILDVRDDIETEHSP